jgi:aminopeptidase
MVNWTDLLALFWYNSQVSAIVLYKLKGYLMSDPRHAKYADLLVNYCISVKPGDKVMINTGIAARPLVHELYRSTLKAGGHPLVMYSDPELREIMLKEGNDDQLQFIPAPRRVVLETFDCQIGLWADDNTRTFSGVNPARQQLAQAAATELMELSMKRSAAGEFRWVGAMFPTNAHAQEADMSLTDYEDFVYNACHIDKEDPTAEWLKVSKRQQKLVDWLVGKQKVRVKGPNADLSLSIAERTFINSDGRKNMPSGEIFTGPVEDSCNGWIRFTYPAIEGGREVTGVELHFEDGKVTKATASKNEEFLHSMLDSDDGAKYLGEFAVGTNDGIDRFTKSTLFDEKMGGTMHMALGAGYPETGSKNHSCIHWDMICDMRDGGQIWVDDELFYDSGNFPLLAS